MAIIGDPATFAIEYEVESAYPPYGRIQLWLEGKRFGDISMSMFLYHMCSSLEAMMDRDRVITPAIFSSRDDAPSDEALLSGCSWTWGESYDDFIFGVYAVQSERMVHFVWKLGRETESFRDYPHGNHHSCVSFVAYDKVVGELLRNLSFDALGSRRVSQL